MGWVTWLWVCWCLGAALTLTLLLWWPFVSRERKFDAAPNFAGGLNVAADESNLQPNEMRRAVNIRLTKFGAALKRGGTKKLHTSAFADAIQGVYCWERAGSSQLLVVAGGTLWTGTYGNPISWTSQGGGIATSGPVCFASFIEGGTNEVVYIADGGLLNRWDGTTLTLNVANSASVTRIWVYNQRLMGVLGTNEKVFWSELNDGDSLGYATDGGGEAIVRTFGDQELTNGIAVGSSSLLFHATGVSIYTGISQDDITIAAGARGLTSDVGTVFARSVVNNDSAAVMLTSRGFYEVTESSVRKISDKIDPIVEALDFSDRTAVIGVHRAALHELWWYLPTIGVMCWNYDLRQWSGPWDTGFLDPVPTAMCEALDATNRPVVLKGDASGWIEQTDYPSNFTDHVASASAVGTGTAYSLILQAYRMFFGDPTMEMSLRWLYLTCNPLGSNQVAVSWRGSTGTSTFTLPVDDTPIWGEVIWDDFEWGGGGVTTQRIPASQRGYGFDVTITDSGTSGSTYSKLAAEAFAMGRRG